MTRRSTRAAEAAAAQASEAARVLAQRSHEVKNESVEAVEPTEPQTTSPDRVEKLLNARPHEQAMDEITKKRGLDVEEEPKEAPAEAPVEAKAEPEAAKPADTAPPVEVQPEAPKTVRVKVDGAESDVPADEVEAAGGVKSYQIQRASENRLAKANALVEESRKQMAQFAAQLQAQNVKQPSKADFIKDRINKIRFGTDEEASVAMDEVVAAAQPRFDQQVMTHQISANLKHDMADAQFKQEFADVLANPMAQKLSAVLHREALLTHAPNGVVNWQGLSTVDWGSLKRNIGNQLRSAFGRQSQPATTTETKTGTTSQPSDKEARKASIVNLPTAAARAEMPKEEKELTPEEERKQWIAEQKKARGLG